MTNKLTITSDSDVPVIRAGFLANILALVTSVISSIMFVKSIEDKMYIVSIFSVLMVIIIVGAYFNAVTKIIFYEKHFVIYKPFTTKVVNHKDLKLFRFSIQSTVNSQASFILKIKGKLLPIQCIMGGLDTSWGNVKTAANKLEEIFTKIMEEN